MHVARRRIGLCGCLPFTNTRRRLLPVPLATVGGRHFNFTIPDASRCPTEGRLLRRIGGRKSELAAAGAGQGLPQRETQDSQDVQWPCPLTYVDTGVYEGGGNDYYEVHTQEDLCWARRMDFVMKHHRIPRCNVE